jgi:hypothetical protein
MINQTFLIEAKEKKLWNKFLNLIPKNKRDIYYFSDYVNLYKNKACEPKCYVYKTKDNIFFYPLIKRKITKTNYFDVITPYGYGGPIIKDYDKKFILEALNNYYGILAENKVICEQIKFHPLLQNVEIFKEINSYNIYMSCNTVTVDCKYDADFMISKIYKKSNKEKIKKIEKKSANVYFSKDAKSIKQFENIYNNNLKNINADKKYFFDQKYYKSILTNLKENFFIANLEINNEILASQMVLYQNNIGHTHLQGTTLKGKKLGVTNFLKHKVILKAKELNIELLNFGGGRTNDENDSLLNFKKSFSNILSKFYIAEKIYNPEIYADLTAKTNKQFFYSYRNDKFIT